MSGSTHTRNRKYTRRGTAAIIVSEIFPPLPPGVREPDWESAACATADPELFTPPRWTAGSAPLVEEAKQVCRGCPIRSGCLEYALVVDEVFGAESVWGGMTPDERRGLANTRPTYRRVS
jgi:WhiB family transcriptional regulator, redox-sensing transcriptional regulator